MHTIEEYKRQTGSEVDPGKCADCANAIWRVLRSDAPETYDMAQHCSLAAHCTLLGRPVTHIIYDCSGYAASDAAQAAELAEVL